MGYQRPTAGHPNCTATRATILCTQLHCSRSQSARDSRVHPSIHSHIHPIETTVPADCSRRRRSRRLCFSPPSSLRRIPPVLDRCTPIHPHRSSHRFAVDRRHDGLSRGDPAESAAAAVHTAGGDTGAAGAPSPSAADTISRRVDHRAVRCSDTGRVRVVHAVPHARGERDGRRAARAAGRHAPILLRIVAVDTVDRKRVHCRRILSAKLENHKGTHIHKQAGGDGLAVDWPAPRCHAGSRVQQLRSRHRRASVLCVFHSAVAVARSSTTTPRG